MAKIYKKFGENISRLLIVLESEFRKNKLETIERVIKWMQSGQK